ncbi:hypothetical protein V6N13_102457 [Hibiscus sabdariffa]|uniref:Uncharacterized protein n=1 Tax=Hibiscus sabdariffa TaxID=183260 RepID=A0ABR2D469_9ROSI
MDKIRLSCGVNQENGLFSTVKVGDIETVEVLLKREPNLLYHTSVYDCHAALHIAAANGQIETVLMLIAMHWKI